MAWGQEKGADVKISALPVSMRFFDFVPCSLPLKTLILLTFLCFLIRRRVKLIQYFSSNHITGWRRKYNVKGHPDFVFLDKRIAIFVDGCFWHGHDCRNTRPAENAEYWKKKRTRNIEHDKAITNLFERRGWSVIRIWECELKKKNRAILDEKLSIITSLPKKS